MDYRKFVLANINRVYKNGLTTTSGGNLSVRDKDDNIYITPSGKDKGTLELEDICKVTAKGDIEGAYKPSMELPFHSKIYKIRPNINAVMHVHSPYLTCFSLLNNAPNTRISPYFYATSKKVGLSQYDIPGSVELGEQIARFIDKGYDSVMMRNHGVVCIASSMTKAYKILDNLENCAKTVLYAHRLGTINTLSNDELKEYLSYSPEIQMNKEIDENYDKQKKLICQFAKRSIEHNYFSAGIGVISMRVDANTMLITPLSYDRASLKESSIIVIKNNVAFGGKPDTSWKLHKEIYDTNPDINSVFLACPPAIMAYGVTGTHINSRTLPESYIMMRDLQRLPKMTDIRDISLVAKSFSPATPIVMIENSCIITTADTITKAFDRLEVSEVTAMNYILTSAMGKPQPISDREIDKIDNYFNLPRK